MLRRFAPWGVTFVCLLALLAPACESDAVVGDDDGSGAAAGSSSSSGAEGGSTPTSSSSSTGGGSGGEAGGTGAQGGGGSGGDGGAVTGVGTCADPIPLAESDSHVGDTSGAADNLIEPTGDCDTTGSGEHVFALTATATGALTLTLTQSTADLVLHLRHGCDDSYSHFGCEDSQASGDEELIIPVIANETYFVVVDGYDGDEGPYLLATSAVVAEASCGNGVDDNFDGLFDCADPSCFADATCMTTIATACAAAATVVPGVQFSGNSQNGTVAFASVNPHCASPIVPTEVELSQYTPVTEEVMFLEMTTASTNQTFFVRASCDQASPQLACEDRDNAGPGTEFSWLRLESATEYTFFVGPFDSGDEDAYTIDAQVFGVDEVEPNDDYTTANVAVSGDVGYLGTEHDHDWYEVAVGAGQTLRAETAELVAGDCAAGLLDTEIEIFDTTGLNSLQLNDDIGGGNLCSLAQQAGLAAGDYFVRVSKSQTFCGPLAQRCRAPYALMLQLL